MENLYKTQKVYNNMACLIDLHGPEIIKMFCNTSFIKKKKKNQIPGIIGGFTVTNSKVTLFYICQ